MENAPRDIESWVNILSNTEIPVLRHTARGLEAAKENIDKVSAREISAIFLHDPMMTARLLAYILPFRGKKLRSDVTTVEHAVMMIGIEPLFRQFSDLAVVEDRLKAHPQALLGLLQVVRRSQRAARYAFDWALWRHDLNVEEVTIAALLHDLAEMLMWCFSPKATIEMRSMQQADKTLRSAAVQEMVLGFRILDLQLALCEAWQLPELLITLIAKRDSEHPRIRNVQLAVDLARHSANGWDDAALPDDFTAIARLLNVNQETLMVRLGLKEAEGSEGEGDAADANQPQ